MSVVLDLSSYCTHVQVIARLRLDLFTERAFRLRLSRVQGDDPFPPAYEIPFAVGMHTNWAPVPFTRTEDAEEVVVTTSVLRVRISKFDLRFTVWTADGSRRICPSGGPVYGMFKDGYTLFAQMNEMVGPEPLPEKKAFGFFQTQHFAEHGSQQRLMTVAREMRRRGIPCDTLILDFEWGDAVFTDKGPRMGESLDWAPAFPNRAHQAWTQKEYAEEVWWSKLRERMAEGICGVWQDTRRNDITDSVIYTGMPICRPMQPECQWIERSAAPDRLSLTVFPPAKGGSSRFEMREDDGTSLRYQQGEVAVTLIACAADASGLRIEIGPTAGTYRGMPAQRTWDLEVRAVVAAPKRVRFGSEVLTRADGGTAPGTWSWDAARAILAVRGRPAAATAGCVLTIDSLRSPTKGATP